MHLFCEKWILRESLLLVFVLLLLLFFNLFALGFLFLVLVLRQGLTMWPDYLKFVPFVISGEANCLSVRFKTGNPYNKSFINHSEAYRSKFSMIQETISEARFQQTRVLLCQVWWRREDCGKWAWYKDIKSEALTRPVCSSVRPRMILGQGASSSLWSHEPRGAP